MSRSPTWASVLKDNVPVNIVVLGDAGVGKTTLVRVFVSDVFIEDPNMRVVEPVHMKESLNFKCPLLVRDTPSALEDHPDALRKELDGADVAILCFAVDQIASFEHLTEYWLPHIEAMRPGLPVLLVGTKRDLDTSPDDTEDVEDDPFLRQTEPVLEQFRCVERTMRCSAKAAVEEVHAVFNQATHMVMYPVAPLYDEHSDTITHGFNTALTRIFRIFDLNRDGALNLSELGTFQQHTFGLKLAQSETESVIEVIRDEFPHGVVRTPEDDGFCLNEDGFKRLVLMFVIQGHPESAWSVLKTFRYNPDMALDVPEFDLPLARRDQSHVLSPHGLSFLEELFAQFSVDHGLGPDQVADVFRVMPGSAGHPFGPAFPYNTRCSTSGSITRESWLLLWRMLAVVDAAAAMRAFYCLGFGLQFGLDATKALSPGPPRKVDGAGVSHERRCFVVGSAGAGKSSLIRHFLNGPAGLRRNPPTPSDGRPTHYVKRPPMPSKADVEEHGVPDDVLAARPSTLVITEWPAGEVGGAMAAAKWQADVVCFVVDPSTEESIAYFERAVDMVPDMVPCFVVLSQHAAQATGSRRVRDMCDRLDIDVVEFSPGVHASQSAEVFQFAAGLAPTPGLDNPQTEARVEREEQDKRWRRMKFVGVVLASAVVVGGAAAALFTERGRRLTTRVKGLLRRGASSARTGLAGAGAGVGAA